MALGGALARALPFPAVEWLLILLAPLLVGALPIVLRPLRRAWRGAFVARWPVFAFAPLRITDRGGR